jgi:hypothetical protein
VAGAALIERTWYVTLLAALQVFVAVGAVFLAAWLAIRHERNRRRHRAEEICAEATRKARVELQELSVGLNEWVEAFREHSEAEPPWVRYDQTVGALSAVRDLLSEAIQTALFELRPGDPIGRAMVEMSMEVRRLLQATGGEERFCDKDLAERIEFRTQVLIVSDYISTVNLRARGAAAGRLEITEPLVPYSVFVERFRESWHM